jgi:hypothetical protein
MWGEGGKKEERLRKTFLVFLCQLTFLKARMHREKKEYEKKNLKAPKSKFLRISSRRASTARRKTKKNFFCVSMLTDLPLWLITQREERLGTTFLCFYAD